MACILHAHLLLLFKNLGVDDVNKTVASVVLSAQVRFFLFFLFLSVALTPQVGPIGELSFRLAKP